MISKWNHLKNHAIDLRKQGISIVAIEKQLLIPRSTLSGWFKDVVLTDEQFLALRSNSINHLEKARIKASEAHRLQKEKRICIALEEASEVLSKLPEKDLSILEIALAMLYLGEGAKKENGLRFGNSNPLIVNFYVTALEKLYGIEKNSLRISLHLRMDQNESKIKKYWANILGIPLSCFVYCIKDPRTAKNKTYKKYNGVCVIEYGPVAIQRKLMYLADKFCKRTISSRG